MAKTVEELLATQDGRVATSALTPQPAPPELGSWLAEAAVPLGLDPQADVTDLEPMRRWFDGARVVGLGEATHGTSEFFVLKHRLARFLIEQLGFTSFAIEGFPADCLVVNAYVRGGDLDPVAAVRMLYGGGSPWDVEEVLAFVEWLRSYNALPTTVRKVGFYGLDIHGAGSAVLLRDYLAAQLPELLTLADSVLPEVSTMLRLERFQRRSREDQDVVLSRLDELVAKLEVHRRDDEAWRDARRCAATVREVAGCPLPNDAAARVVPRDRGQAELVKMLLAVDGPDGKVVCWAHNGHLMRRDWFRDVPACGQYLDEALGTQYVAVGAAFGAGSFRAGDMDGGPRRAFTVAPAPAGTLDAALTGHCAPAFAIDLRRASGPVGEWLAYPLPTRSIGGGFSDKPETTQWCQKPLSDVFDIVVFVRETTAASAFPAPAPLDSSELTGEWAGYQAQTGAGPVGYRVEQEGDRIRLQRAPGPWRGGRCDVTREVHAAPGSTVVVRGLLAGPEGRLDTDVELFVEARPNTEGFSFTGPIPSTEDIHTVAGATPCEVTLRVPEEGHVRVGVRVVGDAWAESGPLTVEVRP